ncbi:hypothetical protein U4960_01295 [Altererythrobacter sp. H2]|uniref:hypothetical protein n=1 Tax=Altererythrobacter sp. H2 TaxID=3108391 RepID=UPI002B4BDCE3|nr:hypothetical protein [Altererythrobacter sp. H2]WRK95994.1 hypothetical protein U4960_01295 [Altererythrobacter sp. H2]
MDYLDMPIGLTATFLLAVSAAIVIGYSIGSHGGPVPRGDPRRTSSIVRKLFDLSLAIALIAIIVSIIEALLSGAANLSFSGLGEAYTAGYEGYERNTGNYSAYFIIYSLTLPFTFISSIWGIYYFRTLGWKRAGLVVLLIFSNLLFHVLFSGKQKQVGDLLIYLSAVLMIKYAIRARRIDFKMIFASIFAGLLAVMLFVIVLGQRYAALGVDAGNINQRILYRVAFDQDHLVFKLFGPDHGLSLALFSTYLSQGYYGLGLAMQTDWVWTRFSGFSYSLSVLVSRFLGFEWQWPNTLLHRTGLETGWDETKWHTVFTHFATDFTWPGTVVLFGIFAFAYARCWLTAVRFQNPFAILLFALLTMGMFFMPANNQLLHSPGQLFTLLMVVFLYLANAGRSFLPNPIGRSNRPFQTNRHATAT